MSRPYYDAAPDYFRAGWAPLPIKGKWPPPTGWTGADGAWPSYADIEAWREDKGEFNIGLRLPINVIGIDVDNYAGKAGASTLAAAEARWGTLPPTWVSTSRSDGTSGIRLYRVPDGLAWPSELPGGGVEIIRTGHRYAMVWPSLHPSTENVYGWITPDADDKHPRGGIPQIDDLPDLPARWVEGLTAGKAAVDIARADLTSTEAMTWLIEHGEGEPCTLMRRALQRALLDMVGAGSRHEAATRGTARIAHLIQQGHVGGLDAIAQLRAGFYVAINHDKARQGEWQRMLDGAVRLAVAVGDVVPGDPCDPAIMGAFATGDTVMTTPAAPPAPAPVTAGNLAPVVDIFAEDAPEPLSAPVPTLDADPAFQQAVALEVAQQRARREAKRILDDEEQARLFVPPPTTFTLTDELALPDDPITYRVAPILPTGGNVLLTAQYKSGKTTLINNLARALADGVPFLGELQVAKLAPGERVAIFNYEVSAGQYRRWLRDAGIVNTDAVAVLNLRGFRVPITNPTVEAWVVKWLVERNVRVWFVDPFARAFTGVSENDNTEVGKWLDTLDVIKQRAGVGEAVLPTHTGRAIAEEGQERARGATRLDDWADVRWLLNKDDTGSRFFTATGRDVDFAERLLTYDENTRRLAIGGGSRHEHHRERAKNAAYAAILNSPGIGSVKLREAMRQTLGSASTDTVAHAVDALINAGRVRVDYAGNGNQKYHYVIERPDIFGGLS